MITKNDIVIVYNAIKEDIFKTPLKYAPKLSALSGANVYLKMEHLQTTGSFKLRGVLSKLYSLNAKDFSKTFVAASTGNHAAAFAYASKKFGFKGRLYMPKNISKEKLKALLNYSLERILFGQNSVEAEAKATQYAKKIGGVLIHPYNDLEIIKGQGTIALEIESQLPQIDTIICPIGGGGLIAGISSYFSENKKITIVGSQPTNASEMYESIQRNSLVAPSNLSTIADAAAGGIEKDSLTFKICRKQLLDIKLLSEESIKKAVAFMYKYHNIIIEPTAALPVAAVLNEKYGNKKNVVIVLTGKKINKQLLNELNKNYGDCY